MMICQIRMRKIYCKECGKYLFTEKRFLEFGGVALCPQCVEKYKFFVVAVDYTDPRHPGSLRCPYNYFVISQQYELGRTVYYGSLAECLAFCERENNRPVYSIDFSGRIV